jgi:hypothetical protein
MEGKDAYILLAFACFAGDALSRLTGDARSLH